MLYSLTFPLISILYNILMIIVIYKQIMKMQFPEALN